MSEQSKPYYFAFETKPDRSLTGHCVRIETHHFPPNTSERKLALLGRDRETDKRIDQLLRYGHENYLNNTDEPVPEDRIKALQVCLKTMCAVLDSIPIHHWEKVLSEDAVERTTTQLIENRKKCVDLVKETGITFESALKLLNDCKRDMLAFDKNGVWFSKVDEFVKLCERLSKLEESGFLARIKPFLQ